MRLHYLQHVSFEGLGIIEDWAKKRGHSVTSTKLFENQALPNTSAFDFLVVMGGPMGVYDSEQYPWIESEIDLIKNAISEEKKVFGVCLGAQLIASALGANVYKHSQKEIGWFPIEKTNFETKLDEVLADEIEVLHWHGDTYDIPAGAVNLYSSQACENQAFLYAKNAMGFQFHLEMSHSGLAKIVEACSQELVPGDYVQSAEMILQNSNKSCLTGEALFEILDCFIKI